METPLYKLTHIFYFVFTYIVALTCFFEYFLTYRNRSFYFRINNRMVSIECQIHHIKVISTINVANNWNPFNKYMWNRVPVPLYHPMNGTSRQGVDKFSHLVIISTRRLLSRCSPYPIIKSSTTLISNMANNNNSMSSIFFQFCWLFNNNLFILQEFIFRKQTFCKCCCCWRSLSCCQTDHSNFYSTC